MPRIWRDSPGRLLVLYLLLYVIATVIAAVGLAQPSQPVKVQLASVAVIIFLAWRVSRGGRFSRIALLLLSMLSFEHAAFTGTRQWSPGVLVLLAIYAVQVALLISPTIYQHTRRSASPVEAPAAPARWTTPPWAPLFALLAGLAMTLVSLGSQAWAAIPGCGPAAATIARLPDRCIGLAEGYPVRFLTAYQGTPLIGKAALVEDWSHWSVVSFAVLCLFLLLHRRPGAPGRQPVTADNPAVA